MIDLSTYERVFRSLPEGILEAEVNAERKNVLTLHVQDGTIRASEAFDQTKYYVRASGQRTGMVYTEDPGEDAEEVLERCMKNAAYSAALEREPMNTGTAPQHMEDTKVPSVNELLSAASEMESYLKADGARIYDLSITCTERELRVLNSRGYDANGRTVHIYLAVSVSFPENGEEGGMIDTDVTVRSLDELDAASVAVKARNLSRALKGDRTGALKAVSIPSGQYDAVLSAQVMRNILMTAWRAFSAEEMKRGGSCFQGRGDKAGSSVFNLINAPSSNDFPECWPIDSEGTCMKEATVVEEGVIVEPLYTLTSAKAEGAVSNGCAGRVPCMTGNVPISLTTVPGLFYVKPGESSEKDLISQMVTGLYLTYSLDLFHTVNIASGEFSIPCGGIYYEKGKPVGKVSQITAAGRLAELFGSIEAVADNLGFDDFYFHNYAVGSPAVLARGLTFAS